MDVRLCEWVNVNRNARLVEKSVKQKKTQSKQPPECVYLTQIVGKNFGDSGGGGGVDKGAQQTAVQSQLACLCSNQVIKIYDQDSLKFVQEIVRPHGMPGSNKRSEINEVGFFKQADSRMLFSCGEDGCLKCWDLRVANQQQPAICFDYSSDPRAFLCADISSQDTVLSAGTSKSIDDAYVYLFDVRTSKNYLYKLYESHSDDVTQIKFDPTKESRFCSASVDGLVCLYDLNQPLQEQEKMNTDASKRDSDQESEHKDDDDDEEEDNEPSDPDLIEQVFNAGSQVQKIGYLSSNVTTSDQIYAITFVDELIIWDLSSHDQVYRCSANTKGPTDACMQNGAEPPLEDEFYFFDCFYLKSSQQSNERALVKAIGDKNGKMQFADCKSKESSRILFETKSGQDADSDDEDKANMMKRTSHKDIIRSSYWNASTNSFFTAGEDGFIFKWQIGQAQAQKVAVEQRASEAKRKIAEPSSSSGPQKKSNREDEPIQKSSTGSKRTKETEESSDQFRNIYFNKKYFN